MSKLVWYFKQLSLLIPFYQKVVSYFNKRYIVNNYIKYLDSINDKETIDRIFIETKKRLDMKNQEKKTRFLLKNRVNYSNEVIDEYFKQKHAIPFF